MSRPSLGLRSSLFFFSLNGLSVPLFFFLDTHYEHIFISSEEITTSSCEIAGLYGKYIFLIKHCFPKKLSYLNFIPASYKKNPVHLDLCQHSSVICVFCPFILFFSHYNTRWVISHFSFILHLTCYLVVSLFYFWIKQNWYIHVFNIW